MDNERYEAPQVVFEGELEVRAGSGAGGLTDDFDIFDEWD